VLSSRSNSHPWQPNPKLGSSSPPPPPGSQYGSFKPRQPAGADRPPGWFSGAGSKVKVALAGTKDRKTSATSTKAIRLPRQILFMTAPFLSETIFKIIAQLSQQRIYRNVTVCWVAAQEERAKASARRAWRQRARRTQPRGAPKQGARSKEACLDQRRHTEQPLVPGQRLLLRHFRRGA